MLSATVTSKGQVTIPKEIRDELGLRQGDKLEFVKNNGAIQIVKQAGKDPFEKWRGYLKDLEGQDVDKLIDEMRGR